MSKTKLHETIKKYRILAKTHKESWNPNKNRTDLQYMKESYDYMVDGNTLFESFIKDLEGLDVF